MLSDSIAQYLGQHVAGLTYSETDGGNVFVDYAPTMPDEAVMVFSDAGGEADSREPYDNPSLEVVIRAEKGSPWARNMWAAIYSELHALRNITLPGGVYLVYLLGTNSGPLPLGEDENGRMSYGLNLHGETINPTKERS